MSHKRDIVVLYVKSLAKTLVCAAAAYAALTTAAKLNPYSVVYNRTASIPLGLYLVKEVSPKEVKLGDIGCFAYSAPAWAEGRNYFPPRFRLCKPVFAGPGEAVERKDGKLYVAKPGAPLQEVALYAKHDSKGRALSDMALPASSVVPIHHWLMLASEKPNSFDSRYLGYIPMRDVRYIATPLVVW